MKVGRIYAALAASQSGRADNSSVDDLSSKLSRLSGYSGPLYSAAALESLLHTVPATHAATFAAAAEAAAKDAEAEATAAVSAASANANTGAASESGDTKCGQYGPSTPQLQPHPQSRSGAKSGRDSAAAGASDEGAKAAAAVAAAVAAAKRARTLATAAAADVVPIAVLAPVTVARRARQQQQREQVVPLSERRRAAEKKKKTAASYSESDMSAIPVTKWGVDALFTAGAHGHSFSPLYDIPTHLDRHNKDSYTVHTQSHSASVPNGGSVLYRNRGSFDVDARVNVFEANIRLLGGLISGHELLDHWQRENSFVITKLVATKTRKTKTSQSASADVDDSSAAPTVTVAASEPAVAYDGSLLRLAGDLGDRLLRTFDLYQHHARNDTHPTGPNASNKGDAKSSESAGALSTVALIDSVVTSVGDVMQRNYIKSLLSRLRAESASLANASATAAAAAETSEDQARLKQQLQQLRQFTPPAPHTVFPFPARSRSATGTVTPPLSPLRHQTHPSALPATAATTATAKSQSSTASEVTAEKEKTSRSRSRSQKSQSQSAPAPPSPSWLPSAWVSLRHGRGPRETPETCLAGAGTLALEFGALSALSGDATYLEAADAATRQMLSLRSALGLLGNGIDKARGAWQTGGGAVLAGIGSGTDSFYEYLLKAFVAFGDARYLDMFESAYSPALQHLRRGPWYVEADAATGRAVHSQFNSLQAFWPGMQSLYGDITPAVATAEAFFALWQRFESFPERYLLDQRQEIGRAHV